MATTTFAILAQYAALMQKQKKTKQNTNKEASNNNLYQKYTLHPQPSYYCWWSDSREVETGSALPSLNSPQAFR